MSDTAPETPDVTLKRLKMRSIRRGIKEMDLVLGHFAETDLAGLSAAELGLYDQLLSENDHDLYQWVSDQTPVPESYAALISKIKTSMFNRANPA